MTARGIARARALGLETIFYTVNDAERMSRLAALGVSGVFSDRPAVPRETLAGAGETVRQSPNPSPL